MEVEGLTGIRGESRHGGCVEAIAVEMIDAEEVAVSVMRVHRVQR